MQSRFHLSSLPTPSPELSPDVVVKVQLDALQNNDLMPDNDGIRAAFAFASPANRENTGPVERFIHMVKHPLYRGLIGFERAELGATLILGTLAQMRVVLVHKGGERMTYIFTLSLQTAAPYAGCWMTDGVLREQAT